MGNIIKGFKTKTGTAKYDYNALENKPTIPSVTAIEKEISAKADVSAISSVSSSLETEIGGKLDKSASATFVTSAALDKKADISAVSGFATTADVAKKADTSAVDLKLDKTASASFATSSDLTGKVDYTFLNSNYTNNTGLATVSANILASANENTNTACNDLSSRLYTNILNETDIRYATTSYVDGCTGSLSSSIMYDCSTAYAPYGVSTTVDSLTALTTNISKVNDNWIKFDEDVEFAIGKSVYVNSTAYFNTQPVFTNGITLSGNDPVYLNVYGTVWASADIVASGGGVSAQNDIVSTSGNVFAKNIPDIKKQFPNPENGQYVLKCFVDAPDKIEYAWVRAD